jgi:PAS domain S-box-containing protein
MSAGQPADIMASRALGAVSAATSHAPAAVDVDTVTGTISESTALSAENAGLRHQLALRNHALDATSTFFVMSELRSPEPVIVYCNKAVADQHGFSQQELIGKPLSFLAQWIGRNPQYISQVSAALRAGETFHYEDEVSRNDGTTFWLGVAIRPIVDATGRLTHSVGVGADITLKRQESLKRQELQDKLVAELQERERMVIELQLAQKLESVGRLAAGIAHEINTPIQYVGDSVHFLRSAYADLEQLLETLKLAINSLPGRPEHQALRTTLADCLQRYDAEFLSAEIPRSFERIFDGVERVTTIVKAMKEFAHPPETEHSPADINHALKSTLLVASNEYKYLATVHTDLGQLPEVQCNIGELNQVFLNLIVNAAHAIKDAGKDASLGEIKLTTAVANDTVIIRIADNGCGVPPENLAKLYDPFFTTKEVGRGSGQGLAITHSIVVDKHGGEIGVESAVGVGTEFTLRLPIAGRGARAAP